jgi:hypothetical protein
VLIGDKAIQAAKDLAIEQIETCRNKIREAFAKSENRTLSVSMTLKFAELDEGGMGVECLIRFIPEKVKLVVRKKIHEGQEDLPLPGAEVIKYKLEK